MVRSACLSIAWAATLLVCGSARAEHTVVYTVGLTFSPRDITIEVDSSVQWIIASTHNVVETMGNNCIPAIDGFMSGETINDLTVRSFTHTFTTEGIYYYTCNPHCADDMRGTVTVVARQDGAGLDGGYPDGDGSAGDGGEPVVDGGGGDVDWPYEGPYGGGCAAAAPLLPTVGCLALLLLRRRPRC